MGLLSQSYNEEVKKSKHADLFEKARTPFAYSTGLDLLDHMNGKWIDVRGDKGYYSLGVDEGTYIMLIGKSGTSKTSIALQMASNIIKGYDEGMIYLDDIEGATDETRIHNITKMSYDEIDEKVVRRNTGINCESFYENISMIARKKEELAKEYPDEFLIHTGKKDFRGEEIVTMPPTVYILDSLALLVPANISEEEQLSGQMSTTAAAKMNAKIFRQVIPKIKKANIILIAINHITTKIEINPMVHTKAAVNYMKPDEAVTGGNVPIYLANNIFKFEAGDKLKDSELYGINGFTVKVTMIKSRSNRAGQEGMFVFDQVRGIDNVLTNLLYTKNNKILKGAGVGLYFDGEESGTPTKFRLSTFKDKYRANKDFRIFFKKMILKEYRKMINKVDLDDENESSNEETTSEKTSTKKKTVKKKKTTKK